MTYQEFEQLALNPAKAEGQTIFAVSEIDLAYLPKTRKSRYPSFKVYRRVIGYSDSLDGAEKLMRKAITHAYDKDEIYCFHINEHLLDVCEDECPEGISWRLYNHEGNLIDQTWFESRTTDNQLSLKYRGRPKTSVRFKAGDIVEVLQGNEVRLAVATHSPIDIEWCWRLRNRIATRMEKEGSITDEMIEENYYLDDSDDQAAVIDGPGYEYHHHIPTLNIMPLRFPLSSRLRKRFEEYWATCLKQEKE